MHEPARCLDEQGPASPCLCRSMKGIAPGPASVMAKRAGGQESRAQMGVGCLLMLCGLPTLMHNVLFDSGR